ncbi:hypothetical protein XENTR_v10009605 [Xenopus tropicalis]|uniref:Progonadoliberin n=2 Tax=Xenopus tropicalis TaxID=8364 RepID=A0A803JBX0_XENTR|nr:hypothetical protein XENTR_v10009605 [Xenopus tropicalis]
MYSVGQCIYFNRCINTKRIQCYFIGYISTRVLCYSEEYGAIMCHKSFEQLHRPLSLCRMKAISTYALLLLVLLFSAHVGHAQHWSYGLRPGGKRDAESLQDMYPETPNEVPLFPELERLECSVPQSRLNVLRGALMSWLDGENRKKI